MARVTFQTTLVGSDDPAQPNVAGVHVPPDVIERLGGRGRIPIKGTINKFPFRTTIVRMHGQMLFVVNRQMREGAGGVKPGDRVSLVLENDHDERTVEVPSDLAAALSKTKGLRDAFDALSFTHRKEHVRAIEEAKKPETRARRIAKAVEMVRDRAKR